MADLGAIGFLVDELGEELGIQILSYGSYAQHVFYWTGTIWEAIPVTFWNGTDWQVVI